MKTLGFASPPPRRSCTPAARAECGEGGDLSRRPVRRSLGVGGSLGEGGYVLLAVMIILVIMGIFMGLAATAWQHVMKREREEELLWRGRQYVRAIELYQTKYPGAFPPNVEILVEQKFLRKAYTDPMVEDGEWKVLRQLSPEIRRMLNPAERGGGGLEGDPSGRSQGFSQRQSPGLSQTQSQRSMTSRSPSRLGGGSEQGLGGIVGVVSTSEEESIRIIDGKNKYNEWLFVWTQETHGQRRPGAPGGRQPGLPGQRPGLGGRQPGFPGQQPGLGGRQPGFPGQQPGLGGRQPGQPRRPPKK